MNITMRRQHTIGARYLVIIFFFFLLLPFSPAAARENPDLKILGDGVFEELGKNTMWQMKRSKKMKSPEEVKKYLNALNKGIYSDWRLPTKHELYELDTIFDFKRNGEVKIQFEGAYWLVGDKGEMSVGAWEIGDQCGPTRTFYRGKKGYVRAVRP